MMGDRNFAASAVSEWLDPLGIILFSFITLVVVGSITLLYVSHQRDQKSIEYSHACVDAGGLPVITHSYVRGSVDGHLCINPSAIIQLKD